MVIENKQAQMVGLALSLGGPFIFSGLLYPTRQSLSHEPVWMDLAGLAGLWLAASVLCLYLMFIENNSLRSIGLSNFTFGRTIMALAIGIICSLLVPALYFVFSILFQIESQGMAEVATKPKLLVIFAVVTNAVTEELLFRAYPLERLGNWVKSDFWSVFICVSAFGIFHLFTWDLSHVLAIVLPLGVVLSVIYLKTRNLYFVIIVHFLIDLPLVFM